MSLLWLLLIAGPPTDQGWHYLPDSGFELSNPTTCCEKYRFYSKFLLNFCAHVGQVGGVGDKNFPRSSSWCSCILDGIGKVCKWFLQALIAHNCHSTKHLAYFSRSSPQWTLKTMRAKTHYALPIQEISLTCFFSFWLHGNWERGIQMNIKSLMISRRIIRAPESLAKCKLQCSCIYVAVIFSDQYQTLKNSLVALVVHYKCP